MAKKKKVAGADIDWYLISIDRLKQIGLIVLILLLGGGAYFFWQRQTGNPKTNAESAIADAKQALNSLAASKDFAQHRNDFDRAQKKLEEANGHLAGARYSEARDSAVESQTISRTAMSGGDVPDNDAQFLTVEGDVQYQKSATSEWKKADPRTALFNGDWVKTSDKASAELIFSNGSLYTIGPNALLEIYSTVNPQTAKKQNAVQMQVGSVEVATSDDVSTVRTPGSQIVVDSESTTQVGVDTSKATDVVTTKGGSAVTAVSGGQPVGTPIRLASGQALTATPQGSLSTIRNVALPPALTTPADNQVFQITPDTRVEFKWAPQSGVAGYQLQVSRSRLFSTVEINTRRTRPGASARITSPGAFYWRVASVGPDGQIGPYSSFRRFRASGGGKSATSGDTQPPPLTYTRRGLGGQYYMVEGRTEPGATVFINDEEVDVEGDGTFKKLVTFTKVGPNPLVIKAVDPAGNPTIKSETVVVNEE